MAKNQGKVEEIKYKVKITGFNSIFAVASIEAAKKYYTEFKKQQQNLIPDQKNKSGNYFWLRS